MTPTPYGRMATVVGQLGQPRADSNPVRHRAPNESTCFNAALLLNRLWIDSDTPEEFAEWRTRQFEAVAAAARGVPTDHIGAVHARRRAAMAVHAAARGASLVEVTITPTWRIVVGQGEDNVHETGLTLSPLHAVPIVPASTLKGLAAAQGRRPEAGLDPTDLRRIFGAPRPPAELADPAIVEDRPGAQIGETGGSEVPDDDDSHARGTVIVLDAFPTKPPKLVVDVLTPHVAPYYRVDDTNTPSSPPAEYHNPIPVRFLAVEATPLRTLLAGPASDTAVYAELLAQAAAEYGVGAKTAAGYGYCTADTRKI